MLLLDADHVLKPALTDLAFSGRRRPCCQRWEA